METIWAALEAAEISQTLRSGRWSYAAVSAAHLFGIALLIGGSLPLACRMAGIVATVPRAAAVRYLAPFALAGLLVAAVAGVLLFGVRATEYAGFAVFRIKLALVCLGTLSAIAAHWRGGWDLSRLSDGAARLHGALSVLAWTGALICGRLVAFV